MITKETFILRAFELGMLKFGNFTLKSGQQSPFYLDLRCIISSPDLLKGLTHLLCEDYKGNAELVCGVPYAALSLATSISLHTNTPLIVKRKEAKKYGTKKLIEGSFKSGDRCILVEDVVTSGLSLFEVIDEIEKEQIGIEEIWVVIDRNQGGFQKLKDKGYTVKALFDLPEILTILKNNNKISETIYTEIIDFIHQPYPVQEKEKIQEPIYKHPVREKLEAISQKKKSNLVASLDYTQTADIIKALEQIGPSICMVKLHCDIIEDFSFEFIKIIKQLSEKHEFLILEDRKFADIGHTQQLQFNKGIYKISEWADLVTVHPIAGEKSLEAFAGSNIGLIAIIEMSSAGTLTGEVYQEAALEFVEKHPQIVGVVAQKKKKDHLLTFMPGVNFNIVPDTLGQQYKSPQDAIEDGADFIIIGRGLMQAENMQQQAEEYRKKAYLK